MSFSFDFVTEPLLDFVTGFTEAIELFGFAASLSRQAVRHPPFPRLKFGTSVKRERASQSEFSVAGAGHRVRCRTLRGERGRVRWTLLGS
jgi:hypothetical protein